MAIQEGVELAGSDPLNFRMLTTLDGGGWLPFSVTCRQTEIAGCWRSTDAVGSWMQHDADTDSSDYLFPLPGAV